MSRVTQPDLDHQQKTCVRNALCLVLTGMLLGLLWKLRFFLFADSTYFAIPIHHDFFPAWLRSAMTLRLAYVISVIATTFAIYGVWHCTRFNTLLCLIALGAISVLLCHQGSYNDATFTAVWWCGVFASWLSWRSHRDAPGHLVEKAASLSRAIVSLVFLGGAVGKWTQEYWSGLVFYEIYFTERDFWFFNWVREQFVGDSLRVFATYYSRAVIVTESLGALVWFAGFWFTSRPIAVVAAGLFFMIGLMSNFWLYSVLAPMIGLALVGWFDPSSRVSGQAEVSD